MSWPLTNLIPDDLLKAKEFIYDYCGHQCSPPIKEAESAEYAACDFKINDTNVKFRIAKITPTKMGLFVTLWKRNKDGITAPYDISDDIGFVIVSTKKDFNFGQFIFPKTALIEHGILSSQNKNGKRALRVYPPWDKTESKQAQKTQKWQLEYFLEVGRDGSIDKERAEKLLSKVA